MNRLAGIALVEILVAVVILGVGLLGLAALQVRSTQMVNEAQYRSQAILLAEDLIERIRANQGLGRANVAAYNGLAVGAGDACNPNFVPPGGNLATQDRAEWTNSVSCLLPVGTARVQVNAAARTVTVNMGWVDRIGDARSSLTVNGSF
ncbi:MAG: type IV pilus modification protein PilV [Marinobacter sp.]|nr:type IV pilus modification protein PilV [Marinobacter sp.]